MTTKNVTPSRIRRVFDTLKELGLTERGFDIRADGVTVYPLGESRKGTAFDDWKQKDADRDPAPRRS